MKTISLLGSTGSIGRNVLAVIRQFPNRYRVAALAAGQNIGELREQVVEFKPECTIDDFAKLDLRIAKVVKAEPVEGADRLLSLELDVGGVRRSVLAGIAKAYTPEQLTGKIVVFFANLKPRTMKFGTSEGMILASGTGGKDIFMLTADAGAEPGQQIS